MKVKLETFLREICEKTDVNNEYPVLTSSKSGLFLQSDYFNKQVASIDNTGYKIIRKGQFTYRAMSDTGEFFPNMLECIDIGIVSPAYPVFEIFKPELVQPEFLKYFFKSHNFQYAIASFAQGSTRTSVKFGKMKTVEINLPSFDEQKKILTIIKKAEQIIIERQQEFQKLDELVKARFIEMFGDPVENNMQWHTDKLNNVCPVNKYKEAVENEEGRVWLLNLDMVEPNSGNILGYVYEDEKDVPSSTISFGTNCVLYSKLRPYLNKVVVPSKSGYATSEMISLDATNVDRHFLATLLRTNSFVSFANSTAYGAKMPRASVDGVKNFDLILPPIELQKKFGTFVEQIDKSKLMKKF